MASVAADPEPDHDQKEQEREHGVKRGRSEEPDKAGDTKRQRTSPGKNSPTATRDNAAGEKDGHDTPTEEQKPTTAGNTRRKSSAVDEKQRSKRLFGALLGNLRQPGDRASKRRQEIESRRKAEIQKVDDERLEDRQKRQEQLAKQRKTAQVKVDEENMHRRHRTILDKANFLQTETVPRLFYRPWDLRDDEEDRIDHQIKDAQDLIVREGAVFNEGHGRKANVEDDNGACVADAKDENSRLEADAKGEVDSDPKNVGDISGQDHISAKSEQGGITTTADVPENVPPTNDNTTNHEEDEKADARPSSSGDPGDGEDDGEHVQEGDEDAVIY